MKIKYISHGAYPTGGFRLEKELCQQLGDVETIRFQKEFKGFFAWIRLFFKAFSHAGGCDAIITVVRLAWPVWLRLKPGRKKLILVVHNEDPRDGKRPLYFKLLSAFLNLASKRPKRIAIVVVADYWKQYFAQKYNLKSNLFLFRNLFSNASLAFYKEIAKKREDLIHLGQFSAKIDKKAYHLLIFELEQRGYECYFSADRKMREPDFPIVYFQTHESYLKQMAMAKCTIILNHINEGWNRVAHESFLVGTPVLAYPGGGLEELIKIANGNLVQNVDEAVKAVTEKSLPTIDFHSLMSMDVQNAEAYAKPIKNWLEDRE